MDCAQLADLGTGCPRNAHSMQTQQRACTLQLGQKLVRQPVRAHKRLPFQRRVITHCEAQNQADKEGAR